MPRLVKIGVGIVILAVLLGGGAGFILSHRSAMNVPTVSVTLTVEPTETLIPTLTATETPTRTATPTVTFTPSPTATYTATLSTLVLEVTAINVDVMRDAVSTIAPTLTASPLPTLLVPSPPALLNAVPTGEMPPAVGWLRYTADNPALQHSGKWDVYPYSYRATTSHYLFTNDPGAALSLRFSGAAARVRYARLWSYGIFEVRIDGRVVTTPDAYLSKTVYYGDFLTTEIFALANGWHTLDIRRLDKHNPASANGYIAIDAIDVYQNGAPPTTAPTSLSGTPTFTPSPAPVQKIQVLVAPPTIPPTATLAPPQVTGVSLTVAYDLNGNKAVEPGEGVRDLTVQLVTADTNQVIASAQTDAQGYVHLETTGTAPLRLVVPYFNRFWDIPARAANTRITLLLPPANRPALIP